MTDMTFIFDIIRDPLLMTIACETVFTHEKQTLISMACVNKAYASAHREFMRPNVIPVGLGTATAVYCDSGLLHGCANEFRATYDKHIGATRYTCEKVMYDFGCAGLPVLRYSATPTATLISAPLNHGVFSFSNPNGKHIESLEQFRDEFVAAAKTIDFVNFSFCTESIIMTLSCRNYRYLIHYGRYSNDPRNMNESEIRIFESARAEAKILFI